MRDGASQTRAPAVEVIAGRGAVGRFVGLTAGRRVLVVATAATLERSGLGARLPAGAEVFSDFSSNPLLSQGIRAAEARSAVGAELVIGIGGGSALDVAKAARALPADPDRALRIVLERHPAPDAPARLLVVPTTAGTGSEVTPFATFYHEGRKVSLDADRVRPDKAIVDPALTDSCPPGLTWCCALDALAHAIESIWSTRSTPESRAEAEAALRLLVPVLTGSGPVPDRAGRDALSAAATLAGRAIDRTRTTGGHAFAYPLTARFGVPHGLACALNLVWLADLVERVDAALVVDDRGPAAVRRAVSRLRDLLGAGPDLSGSGLSAAIRSLLDRHAGSLGPMLGRLHGLPVERTAAGLAREGLSSDRLAGMPIALREREVRSGLADLLTAAGHTHPAPERPATTARAATARTGGQEW